MGKEKEILKKVLANTELIMKHLNIAQDVKKESAGVKKEPIAKLPAAKKGAAVKK